MPHLTKNYIDIMKYLIFKWKDSHIVVSISMVFWQSFLYTKELIYYIDKGVAKNLTKTILLPLVTRAYL